MQADDGVERLRFAVLDAYDGTRFHVSDPEGASRFTRIVGPAGGASTSIRVDIRDGYGQPWVPLPGDIAAAAEFPVDRDRAIELEDRFFTAIDRSNAIVLADDGRRGPRVEEDEDAVRGARGGVGGAPGPRGLDVDAAVAAAAAVVGGLWSFIAPHYFHVSAPWAAPAAALVAVAYFDSGWLRYAGHRRTDPVGRAARTAALGIVSVFVVTSVIAAWLGYVDGIPANVASFAIIAPLAALTEASPLVLIVPALLAIAANTAVRRSLLERFPPRFAAQSLVLTQLQAMRTFQVLAGIAGVRGGQEADAGERARLLAALHDRPGATRPTRSLRPPGLDQPAWRAIAWRTASELYRRPRFAQARALLLTISAATALLAAAQVMSAPAPTAPTVTYDAERPS